MPRRRRAFERFIRRGGGFVGVHSATDTEYDWPFYGALVGAYFAGHPDIQNATIQIEDAAHPSTASLPRAWMRRDEWYNFRQNPRGTRQRARDARRAHLHRRHNGAGPSRSCGRTPTRAAAPSTPPAGIRRKASRRRPSSITSGGPFSGRLVRYDFARMSSEDEQIQQRRANLAKLSELGVDAYPHRFDRTATITDLVRAHGEKTGPELEATRIDTTTSGRILGIRNFGKANFLVLSDGRSRIQVYIKKDSLSERDFEMFRLLDFGDIVGVEGHLFRTRTNELTIWASRIEFLAKCHLPLPEKWHGLTDIEIRYRQRYLDLIVNPEAREVFQVRSKVARGDARVSRQPRVSRGRDADDAADRRRRDGAPVPHASQRARHRSVSADRARAVPQAPGRRRPRARVRDQRGIFATRGSRRATIPNSRCSSSIRPTATTRT